MPAAGLYTAPRRNNSVNDSLPYLGSVLQLFGFASVLPIFVAWAAGEQTFLFFVIAAASFAFGTALSRLPRDLLTVRSTATIAALSLVVCGLLASVPFLTSTDPLDAVFQSFSALTGTAVSDVSSTLLVWQTLLAWLGAIGLLAAIFLLLDSPAISAHYLYRKGYDLGKGSPLSRLRNMLLLFVVFTALGAIALAATGVPLLSAGIQAMQAVSLAGLGNGNPLILGILLILGALPFFLHEKLLQGSLRGYLHSAEVRLFAGLVLVFGLLLLWLIQPMEPGQAVFHVLAALTTTQVGSGLATSAAALFLIAMLVGPPSGSVGGGLKLIRALVLVRGIPWLARRATQPVESTRDVRAGRVTVADPEIALIALFSALFLLILLLAVIAYTLLGLAPLEAVTVAIGMQTNTAVPNALPDLAKVVSIVQMVLGRLELFPLFLLLAKNMAFHRLRGHGEREISERKEEKPPFSFFP